MKLRKYTIEQLQIVVKTSSNYRQALSKLHVIPAGDNYETFKKAIKYFKIDSSHFIVRTWNKGRKFPDRGKSIKDYLSNKYPIQSYKLKNKLLKAELLNHKYASCNRTKWFNKSIPLELHHKDSIRNNNELIDLKLICPNCHALTPIYRGKNI